SYIKEKYNIEKDFLLYLGGFSARKNVRSILIAFSKIYKKLSKDLNIVIIGPSKDEHQKLTELAKNLGIEDRIQFTGYVPHEDLPLFYNACETFIYPSLYEGFGLPPLEAMSCRCPVITSNISSIPEIVGDGAYLINPRNIEELTTAIEKMVDDTALRSSYIEKGFTRSKEFSWEKTAKETLEVYNSIYRTI
ncbi:MAG: glycosyltransferase family 1 protein, partial [Clostridium sp.]